MIGDDPFLDDLTKRHKAEMKLAITSLVSKVSNRKQIPIRMDDFGKVFERFYQVTAELIDYKIEKRIAEERQEVINERSKEI